MNLINILSKDRLVKEFSDRKIDEKKAQLIIEAGLMTSLDLSYFPLNFVVVEEKNIIEKLKYSIKEEPKIIESCAILIVVCAEIMSIPDWYETACKATVFMQLMASDLNIDSTCVYLKNLQSTEEQTPSESVSSIINLPMQFQAVSLLCLGYQEKSNIICSNEESKSYKPQDLSWEKVHINDFYTK